MSSSGAIHVAHYGVVGEAPGGMAQVVNEIMTWPVPGVRQSATATTRYRRDPLAAVLSLRAARSLISRSTRPHIAVFHMSERGSFLREGLLLELSRMLKIPRVIHLHGADFVAFADKHPSIVRRVLRRATTVVVLTEESRSVVAELAPNVRIELIPNAVRVPTRSTSRERTIIFCGELGTRKGTDVLLTSWSRVEPQLPGWRLQLVGPLHNAYSLPETPPRVELIGSVPRDVALDMQAKAAIAVLPSRAEALPMFLIEAMARGCVPISTTVGQIPMLVEGVGYLVGPGDSVDLGAAIVAAALEHDTGDERTASAVIDRIDSKYSAAAVAPLLGEVWADAAKIN